MTNHLGQTATAVVVVGVALEVLGQVVDAVGQNSDLNRGRSGVAVVDRLLLNDCLFFLSGHDVFHLSKYNFFAKRVSHRDRRVKVPQSSRLSESRENAMHNILYHITNGL